MVSEIFKDRLTEELTPRLTGGRTAMITQDPLNKLRFKIDKKGFLLNEKTKGSVLNRNKQFNQQNVNESLTLFRGCKFTPLTRFDWKKNLGRRNFFTFNFIILDMFCENLVCLAPLIQILQLFFEIDHQNVWSEPCKMNGTEIKGCHNQ